MNFLYDSIEFHSESSWALSLAASTLAVPHIDTCTNVAWYHEKQNTGKLFINNMSFYIEKWY